VGGFNPILSGSSRRRPIPAAPSPLPSPPPPPRHRQRTSPGPLLPRAVVAAQVFAAGEDVVRVGRGGAVAWRLRGTGALAAVTAPRSSFGGGRRELEARRLVMDVGVAGEARCRRPCPARHGSDQARCGWCGSRSWPHRVGPGQGPRALFRALSPPDLRVPATLGTVGGLFRLALCRKTVSSHRCPRKLHIYTK
jgi:hypothetical protein